MRSSYARAPAPSVPPKQSSLSRLHRLWQNNFYPIALWTIVLGILAVVAAVRIIGALRQQRRSILSNKSAGSESEALVGNEPAEAVMSKGPLGSQFLSRWRIIMYSWTIPLGFSYRMTIMEVIFSAMYLIALLTLGLVDSASVCVCVLFILT